MITWYVARVKFLLESQDTLREVHYIHILISPTRLDTIGLSSPSGDGSSKVAAGTRSGNQELRIYCSVYNSGKLSQLLSQKVLLRMVVHEALYSVQLRQRY
jgi:hypothetical protein